MGTNISDEPVAFICRVESVFVYDFCNDALSSSDYRAMNDEMINEW
jgi:hypothetical protein